MPVNRVPDGLNQAVPARIDRLVWAYNQRSQTEEGPPLINK